ncbi:Protein kinase domain [Macleaya cordata]|uniref:non-specific serine/threonine protein kinase n=1 Tax=Macleaya cordata TaxID=56857 RepID=A0A200PWY1_MACCD|nr:Protein kinase domain [Macleaya cordata]
MTTSPSPSFTITINLLLIAVVFPTVFVHGLGSASTIAVTYGSGTVCGILAGKPNQRIECYRRGQVISLEPIISYDAISGGRDFFCGLRSGGFSFFCWSPGDDSYSSFLPKRIYFNTTIRLRDLTVGENQVCAVENVTGVANCWWREAGEKFRFLSPQKFQRFQSITSGRGFSCGVLKNTNGVRCWGISTTTAAEIQNQFGNVSMLSLVAGDSHVCGLNYTGFLICKGKNSSGQLDFPFDLQPFEFSGLALGVNHSCAIRRLNGSVVCWGGDGKFSSNEIEGFSFESIVAGSNFTCGLTTRNLSLICWGPGWSLNPNLGMDLPLPNIIPGPCTQTSCSKCGIYPDSGNLCSGSGNICKQCESSTLRRQSSRSMRRQRSGPSSKHADRAEEFSFSELAAATNGFSLENKIGSGSFGIVYRGKLPDGREVAIKRGETGSKTKRFQEKESAFESELAFLSRLHHKHLVSLVGFCEENDERLLVYEYMKNGALYDHIHSKNNTEKSSSVLNSWKMRIKVLLDAARGIEYLHNYAVPPIIHRDIKSSNILLDANWVARVSDFGLSLMGPQFEGEYMSAKAAGTVGYMDPEYYGLNVLTAKSDVYGLGVVLLELLTGRKAIFKDDEDGEGPTSVVDFAVPKIRDGELGRVLDVRIGPPDVNEAEAVELVANMAVHCVNLEGKERPSMTDIVANLERALALCDDSHGSISSASISVASE